MKNLFNKLYYPENEIDENGRNYFFDNLKFVLIFLVVFGHFLEPLVPEYNIFKNLYIFIYIFHMPLFVYVTGYFAKSIVDKENNLRVNKIISIFILYVLIKVIDYLINIFVFNVDKSFNLFLPSVMSWYLLATCLWYLTVPLIKNIKPIVAIAASVVIALLVGYDKEVDSFLTLSRLLVFYPFFLLGYYTNKEKINKFLNPRTSIRIIAIISVIIISLLMIFNNVLNIYQFRELITGRNPYSTFTETLFGGGYRFILYVISSIIGIAFMLLIPKCKTFFTKFGSRTIQIYFFHIIALTLIRESGLDQMIIDGPAYYKLLPLMSAIILTFILSLKPFGWALDKILNMKLKFIYNSNASK